MKLFIIHAEIKGIEKETVEIISELETKEEALAIAKHEAECLHGRLAFTGDVMTYPEFADENENPSQEAYEEMIATRLIYWAKEVTNEI